MKTNLSITATDLEVMVLHNLQAAGEPVASVRLKSMTRERGGNVKTVTFEVDTSANPAVNQATQLPVSGTKAKGKAEKAGE